MRLMIGIEHGAHAAAHRAAPVPRQRRGAPAPPAAAEEGGAVGLVAGETHRRRRRSTSRCTRTARRPSWATAGARGEDQRVELARPPRSRRTCSTNAGCAAACAAAARAPAPRALRHASGAACDPVSLCSVTWRTSTSSAGATATSTCTEMPSSRW